MDLLLQKDSIRALAHFLSSHLIGRRYYPLVPLLVGASTPRIRLEESQTRLHTHDTLLPRV
jgi:hypothetical protein